MDNIVTDFLNRGPPWIGVSSFADKADVKEAGGRWDSNSKKWCARDEQTLKALITSGKWQPFGYDAAFGREVVECVKRRQQATAEHDNKQKPAAPKRAQLLTSEEMDRIARKSMAIPPDEPELLAEALRHGVDQKMVTETGGFAHLGPRSGISDVGRLFRGIRFGIVTWERLKNGEETLVSKECSTRQKQSSATDEGKREQKRGVKRGVEYKGDMGNKGGTSSSKAKSVTKSAAMSEDCWYQEKYKKKKKVERMITYRYTNRCNECGSIVNSSKQFGLECECSVNFTWNVCGRCRVPKRDAGYCTSCVAELESMARGL